VVVVACYSHQQVALQGVYKKHLLQLLVRSQKFKAKGMEKLFVATLIMPDGIQCKFLVSKVHVSFWEFSNQNLPLTIYICKGMEGYWCGTLSTRIGNDVQHNNLICQAVFELRDFYKNRKLYHSGMKIWQGI
jgi:hypothetical protein